MTSFLLQLLRILDIGCGMQDRLVQEQQHSEQLQSQLHAAQASHDQAAAAAASQLAAAQQGLSQLEQEATEKLSQADAAAAEAEGQLDDLLHELEEARDAVKVASYMLIGHQISGGVAVDKAVLLDGAQLPLFWLLQCHSRFFFLDVLENSITSVAPDLSTC